MIVDIHDRRCILLKFTAAIPGLAEVELDSRVSHTWSGLDLLASKIHCRSKWSLLSRSFLPYS